MKNTFLTIIFLIALNCYSQNNRKLTVVYTLFISENSSFPKSNDIRNMISNESGKLNFNLYINDSVSYFIERNGIASSDLVTKLAISKTKYSTPIFYNSKLNFQYNNNPNFIFFKTNEYLINKNIISDWVITNETKTIDGHICYNAKATDYYYHKGDEIREYEINAWFCPKLPFNFGPVFYNNLPGLILEISYLDMKLVATKIDNRLDENNIIRPFGEKSITFDEYYKKFNNTVKEMLLEVKNMEK